MIEILPQSTERCLLVHFSGKVTGVEYQQFMDRLVYPFRRSLHPGGREAFSCRADGSSGWLGVQRLVL